MKKVAISSSGKELGSLVSECFGKGGSLVIVRIDNGTVDFESHMDVPGSELCVGGAIAGDLAKYGIDAVVTGHIGCKAYNDLNSNNIDVYLSPQGKTVREVANLYSSQMLSSIDSPNPLSGDRCTSCGGACPSCHHCGH